MQRKNREEFKALVLEKCAAKRENRKRRRVLLAAAAPVALCLVLVFAFPFGRENWKGREGNIESILATQPVAATHPSEPNTAEGTGTLFENLTGVEVVSRAAGGGAPYVYRGEGELQEIIVCLRGLYPAAGISESEEAEGPGYEITLVYAERTPRKFVFWANQYLRETGGNVYRLPNGQGERLQELFAKKSGP